MGFRPLEGATYGVYQIRDGTLQVPQEDAYPPIHHVHASQPTHLTEVQESGRITDMASRTALVLSNCRTRGTCFLKTLHLL